MTSETSLATHANKRTPDQRRYFRKRAMRLYLTGKTQQEIADILAEETGIEVSRRQIGNDLKKVREDWLSTQREKYEYYVTQELERLDALEHEAWKNYASSIGERIDEVVHTRSLNGDDITRTRKKYGPGSAKMLDLILKIQQDRRKLLGVYAPSKLGINVAQTHEVVVKGYSVVSPEDWPSLPEEVVEGEVED